MVNTWTFHQGLQRAAKTVWIFSGGVWKASKFVYVFNNGAWKLAYKQRFDLTLATNQTDFNLKTWFLTQGWNGTSLVELHLTANAAFDPSSVSNYAFDIGTGWPSGSLLFINGKFTIRGRGGVGGAEQDGANAPGNPGQSGGPAMSLPASGCPITSIDFTQGGFIGGGGGGAGGGESFQLPEGGDISWGQAGGNGAGPNAATGPGPSPPHVGGHPDEGFFGGGAGSGGDFGNGGPAGGQAHRDDGLDAHTWPPAPGGAAGKAIDLHGNGITLIGNNSSNLRGGVS